MLTILFLLCGLLFLILGFLTRELFAYAKDYPQETSKNQKFMLLSIVLFLGIILVSLLTYIVQTTSLK